MIYRLVLVMLLVAPALDAQVVKFTALTLHEAPPPPHLPPRPNQFPAEIHMEASFTLADRTGTYYIPFYDALFKNSKVNAITKITGTLRIQCNGQRGCPGDHTYTISDAPKAFVKGDGGFFTGGAPYHTEYIPFQAKASGSTANMIVMDNRDNLWLLVFEGQIFYEVPVILFRTQ